MRVETKVAHHEFRLPSGTIATLNSDEFGEWIEGLLVEITALKLAVKELRGDRAARAESILVGMYGDSFRSDTVVDWTARKT
jgi:hypothetical protein